MSESPVGRSGLAGWAAESRSAAAAIAAGRRPGRVARGGRHGLSREQVASSQRSRIIAATVELVGRDGFHPVSVSEIVARAGVSRKTFYVHFEGGKEEALAAGYAEQVGVLVDKVARRSQGVPLDSVEQRLRLRLTLLLDALASDQTVARMLFVEVLAAGQLALEHRDQGVLRLARALLHDTDNDDDSGRDLSLLERAATGGLWEVLHHEIAAGRIERLPALGGELHAALVEIVVGRS